MTSSDFLLRWSLWAALAASSLFSSYAVSSRCLQRVPESLCQRIFTLLVCTFSNEALLRHHVGVWSRDLVQVKSSGSFTAEDAALYLWSQMIQMIQTEA